MTKRQLRRYLKKIKNKEFSNLVENDLTKISVGSMYPADNIPEQDSAAIQIQPDGGINILITLNEIKEKEIFAFRNKIRYGLLSCEIDNFPMLLWLWKFGDIVMDTPFNLALEDNKIQNRFLSKQKNLWNIILIEGKTKLIKAIITKPIDKKLVHEMHKRSRLQLTSNGDFQESLNKFYLAYPDPEYLWDAMPKVS